MAGMAKLKVMNSMIGFRPAKAAPTPRPAKPCSVIGVSNLHIYAAMRGESLEDFQKTRNAPGALYSVAGQDSKTLSWNT